MSLPRIPFFALLSSCTLSLGCGFPQGGQRAQGKLGDPAAGSAPSVVPARGATSTLDIASWNVEWFGDTTRGPSDETLQLENVREIVAGADMDIWGLTEIVDSNHWTRLKSELPAYSGLLADEADVRYGPDWYHDGLQKVGILYKTSLATVEDARVILTQYAEEFAGRPPLQVTLRATLNSTTRDLIVIVIHAKCCPDPESWTHRVNASNALKTYLDVAFPTEWVWVIGDFNDDIDASISLEHSSPYANFMADEPRYEFVTRALSDSHVASTVGYTECIDHHLTTDEGRASYIAGSTEVYRVDRYVFDYATTTSDHFPVLSRYLWQSMVSYEPSSGSGAARDAGTNTSAGNHPIVVINEIGANEPAGDTSAEFVELVNLGPGPADLSGWTISDASNVRHGFAPGQQLERGGAIVVFGGADALLPGLDNAVAASSGKLSLGNSGDSVVVRDSTGVTVDEYTYTSAAAGTDGTSLNRTPDGSKNEAFVLHTVLSALAQSPGKRVDGSDW